ncbi:MULTISPECIES: protein phosphatase CheZ [Caldimonas]|uniref:protein phosphatase CheZ n=1 Tax=Caldimonas TaxID=196013 RepID=UPI00039CA404|nr:protein phosphatase CheZ [Caldimonas manganoxidans]MCX7660397.1 protein phosphatase CheZ [Caldimonas manganoxidans]
MSDTHNSQGASPPLTTSPEVYQRIGEMTRNLHDTLAQLGFMPKLGEITESLPDARSRLNYIAIKTGEAAEKVLNLVDQAKAEHEQIAAETRRIAQAIVADPVRAVASGSVMNFVSDVEARSARIDQYLTDIMMAQDFHDLTGQVVARVVKLAADIEDQLVKLLLQTAPPDQVHKVEQTFLNGPVVNPEGRTDVVTSQEQVDDLLASLGF